MRLDTDYVSLTHTLRAVKRQAQDSLPFIGNYIPDDITSPRQLYYYFKSLTTYKSDPLGVEHIQMAQTLLDRGGYGDCDCFTVLSLAGLWYIGAKPLFVTIVGKTKAAPSHIYVEVYDEKKKEVVPFDLTNRSYGYERSYNFKQRLPITL